MKKIKTEKGITLVALIITIVVLLILATVAITSMQESDIIGYTNNAAMKYNGTVTNESGTLGEYENFLGNYSGSSTGGENNENTGYTLTLYDNINTSSLDGYVGCTINNGERTIMFGYSENGNLINTFTIENVKNIQFFINESFGLAESLGIGTEDTLSDICLLTAPRGGVSSDLISLSEDAVWYVTPIGKGAPEL